MRTLPRAGFTLVELVVVLTLIALLAALTLALVPRMQQQERAATGADQVQGWLLVAKQRARRDGRPVGIRLQVPILTTATNAVTSPGPATVVPTAMSGLQDDALPWAITGISHLLVADDDKGLNAETVQVQAVTTDSFTAVFTKPHPAGFVIRPLGYVQILQYVEQPDDFLVVPGVSKAAPQVRRLSVSGSTADLEAVPSPPDFPNQTPEDFTGGFGPNQLSDWPVQPGDYLEVFGGGLVRQIQSVESNSASPNYGTRLNLNPIGAGNAVPLTAQYRIVRGPRPLKGEEDLPLPQSVAIDLGTNFTYGNPLPVDPVTGNLDILFAPSGALVGRGQGSDRVILWVRDATQASVFDGEPTLVTVYGRTGFIAAQPVDPTSGNPYSYTLDGRASGF
jgi:prepilin-type N-terminal cleavage/methylation domain-containing protein